MDEKNIFKKLQTDPPLLPANEVVFYSIPILSYNNPAAVLRQSKNEYWKPNKFISIDQIGLAEYLK